MLQPLARPNVNMAFSIFTLFGDYLIPYSEGAAWTQEIIYLTGLLGLPERSTRTTLARMKNRGWFTAERIGRRSRYSLTERGRDVLEQGRRRIFEPPQTAWDESWQVVVYSLPEEIRTLRDEFRKKLVWFGFGNLASGTWVASHDRRDELEAIVADLGIGRYVALFQGRRVGMMSNQQIVEKCWDLTTLDAAYQKFVETWQPRYEQFKQAEPHSAEFCFQESFWLTFDFQPFPRQDPNLPVSLLPADWSGHVARQIFHDYRQHLRQDIPTFLAQLRAHSGHGSNNL